MSEVQARNALSAPSCGCKPSEVGYQKIALGTCCGTSDSSKAEAGLHDIAMSPRGGTRSGSGDGDSGGEDTALAMPPQRPCCSAAPLLDAELDEDNPEVVPACCS